MSVIEWNESVPIFLQLKQRIIDMMLGGELKPGDALPSVRQVAADYQINPITVSRSYQELAGEGLVEKRRGVGMFVTDQAAQKLQDAQREHFLQVEWPQVIVRIRQLGLDPQKLFHSDLEKYGAKSNDH